ncbi:glycosyltransferase [Tenacibaculum mesophilum]|uniref:Glycosyltransferase n=1 Tax=Tenacibaculum mesophilum TaxID=104268 RepID=A0AAE9MLI1_9FLAO|nr:glycosyltransferase [Tenacibaculum mesophilum]KAF9658584.1 glycosyltransferase [Tenacibaculum mesophilum]UTD15146.1 glycosyltransferase [Tenacibaculum mesophilum]
MKKSTIAFIITVYKKDKLKYFKEAIETIVNQDYGFQNINIYLGVDGELSNEVDDYINENIKFFYKIIKNKENKGLAFTLNRLIETLENEYYIFRMDSDDVCYLDRATKQVNFMEKNPDILISGGAIEEFSEEHGMQMIRTYPKNSVKAKKYIYKASIFAHPAVCFKKDFFNKGFRYDANHKFSQDVDLWFRALNKNIEIANIKDVVLKLRVQDNFYKRRSYKKAIGEFKIYYKGIITNYGFSFKLIYPLFRLLFRLLPVFLVEKIYNSKLRKKLNN